MKENDKSNTKGSSFSNLVTNLSDTRFSHQDFVTEKRGRISADY